PFALNEVSFVYDLLDAQPVRKEEIGERLRILAVFSLPAGGRGLAVRNERYTLTREIRLIAERAQLDIELRVLQYGDTLRRLRSALDEGEGWDVVHFSGHGLPGFLKLEHGDGTDDVVGTDELVKWLRVGRTQLKLVILSTCASAGSTGMPAL